MSADEVGQKVEVYVVASIKGTSHFDDESVVGAALHFCLILLKRSSIVDFCQATILKGDCRISTL